MLISLEQLHTLRRARELAREAQAPREPNARLAAYVATREAKVLAESASMRAARVLGKDTHK